MLNCMSARKKVLYIIEPLPTPTESDAFTQAKLRVQQSHLAHFDYILVHTPRSIPILNLLGVQRVESAVWPHFPSLYHPVEHVEPTVDVLFLGSVSPYRRQVLQTLDGSPYRVAVRNNVFHAKTSGLFARAKLVLNIHFTALSNFECRVLEALGCGACLLTERLDPSDVFLDGEHLVTFTPADLERRVAELIENQDERRAIAAAGHAAVGRFSVERLVSRVLEIYRMF